jgi:hypothetical protein
MVSFVFKSKEYKRTVLKIVFNLLPLIDVKSFSKLKRSFSSSVSV